MTRVIGRLAPLFVMLIAAAGAVAQTETQPAAPPQPPNASGSPDTVIMTVNGDPVYAWQVNLMLPQVTASMQRQGIEAEQQQIVQAAMQQVVQTRLLAQEARRLELSADAERVAATMQQIENQAGGAETLATSLGAAGITPQELRDAIVEADLVQVLVETQVVPSVKVTDEDVASFYADNPAMFATPDQVRARHILMTAGLDASVEEAEEARRRAEEARQRALAGEDFAALAQELSQGPSAPDGGDLGFFDRQRMVEPFASAAFALEPGAISQVVRTRFGYHVIKVEEKRPAGTMPFEDVRDRLQPMLLDRQVRESVDALVVRLGDDAEIVQAGDVGAAPDVAAPAEDDTQG